MAWGNGEKRDWMCKKCTTSNGDHFRNYGWRTSCKMCGTGKGQAHWKDVPNPPPRSGRGAVSSEVIELQRQLREAQAKLKEMEKPADARQDGNQKEQEKDELAKLRKEVDMLKQVSGPEAEAAAQAKQQRIQELQAKQRAEKPTYAQLKELDEKLEKRRKALERQEGSVIPGLQQKLIKAQDEASALKDEIKQLQEQKDELLQPASGDGHQKSPAARAEELLAEFKGPLDGPGAEPYQWVVEQLRAEVVKFKDPHEGDALDIDLDDLDEDDEAEWEKMQRTLGEQGGATGATPGEAMGGSKPKCKAALAAIRGFAGTVRSKQFKKR